MMINSMNKSLVQIAMIVLVLTNRIWLLWPWTGERNRERERERGREREREKDRERES